MGYPFAFFFGALSLHLYYAVGSIRNDVGDLGTQVGKFWWRGHSSIFTNQILVGYPAGAGSPPSDVNPHPLLNGIFHQLFDRRPPQGDRSFGNRVFHQ